MRRRAEHKGSLHRWLHPTTGMSRKPCATCWATVWHLTLSCSSWCPSYRRSALILAYRTRGIPDARNTSSDVQRGPQQNMYMHHQLTAPLAVWTRSPSCPPRAATRLSSTLEMHASSGTCSANRKSDMRKEAARFMKKYSRSLDQASPRGS